jgi:hypothetical protein
MNETKIFREDNKETMQLFFAIKNSINTEGVTELELKKLLQTLRKSHRRHFINSRNLADPTINGGAIIDTKSNRQIIITPASLEYTEPKLFHEKKFNHICQMLYDFYTKTKQVDLEDISVVGKVFSFVFSLDENAVDYLKQRTGLFADKDLAELSIKSTIIEEDKNIHIHTIGRVYIESEDGNTEKLNKKLQVKLDINNRNQTTGISETTFDEVIQLADDFSNNSLIDVLNTHFA